MRRSLTLILAGVIIGLLLGVVGTLGAQYLTRRPPKPVRQQASLLSSAPFFLENAIPGAKVLDVSVQSPSEHSVNYVYDDLYDVHYTYRRGNQVKSLSLPFGFANGTPIVPSTTDFVVADDSAKVVRTLSAAEAQHPLEIYLASWTGGNGLHEVHGSDDQKVYVAAKPDLDERDIASVGYAVRGDVPAIKLTFTKSGAQRYHDLTNRSLGKPLAFVASGKLLMAPIIEGASSDTSVFITAALTENETKALALSLSRAVTANSRTDR